MAAPSLLKKEIVQIPLKDEIPERQICLVYDSQHPMGAAARELKKYHSIRACIKTAYGKNFGN